MWNQNLGVYKYGPVPLFQQCANHGIFQTWLILARVSSFPRLAIGLLQVVATALSAAQHRRDRLVAMRGATTPTTPDSCRGSAIGMKRKDFKKDNPSSASTAASSAKPLEKVTPDAKQIRTGCEPAPKSLFMSPDGGMDVDEGGGFSKSFGNSFMQTNALINLDFKIQSFL